MESATVPPVNPNMQGLDLYRSPSKIMPSLPSSTPHKAGQAAQHQSIILSQCHRLHVGIFFKGVSWPTAQMSHLWVLLCMRLHPPHFTVSHKILHRWPRTLRGSHVG